LGTSLLGGSEAAASLPSTETRAAATPSSEVASPTAPRSIPWTSHLGLPFSFGHGSYHSARGSGSGLWLALRAQALFGPDRAKLPGPKQTFALGPYAELGFHPVLGQRHRAFGAGIAFAWWFSRQWAVVPAFGWYEQDYEGTTQHGAQAGLFVGPLQREWGPLSLPIGFRLDTRFGLGGPGERSYFYGGEADTALAVAIPVAFYLLATADWDFD
jgi:hypothetical protein